MPAKKELYIYIYIYIALWKKGSHLFKARFGISCSYSGVQGLGFSV